MAQRFSLRPYRPTWNQIVVSLLIAGLGFMGAQALSQIDQDLRIMYTEYTLAATDLAHISADIIRYRTIIIRSVEAPTKKDFDRITASLPDQRARIQHAIDRYAAASLRVSRSGRSEPEDLHAVMESLDAYFAAASRTIGLMVQMWMSRSPQDAAELRTKAEHHAADNSGPKLIQVSLALDRLLETVADVAKDMRDEGTKTIRATSSALMVGSIVIAFVNLLLSRAATSPERKPDMLSVPSESNRSPVADRDLSAPISMSAKEPDPLFRQN
ncbi:MAG: MCP four helix bundle domain-containing protein [Nitrospiraceae bacterium]